MPKLKAVKKAPQKNTLAFIVCQNVDCEHNGEKQSKNNYYNINSDIVNKYPICKDCIKKLVNPDNIQSIYKIFKDMDLPFVKNLWDTSYNNAPKNVFGYYLRMLNSLPQYKGMKWENSCFEQEKKEDLETKDEQKIYNSEWMGHYTKNELEYLNNYYKGLCSDFKVTTISHKDYAKKICKVSLAMEQEYERMIGGTGSDARYKSLRESFDTLNKSAQFAESTRGINDVGLGGFGVIFDKVEKRMYVPQHQPENKDLYDKLLDQFANIQKSL